MALYDILGKSLNSPVYNILGGLVRERVLLSHSLSMGDPSQIAEQAKNLVDQGYKTVKCKIGQNLAADIAVLDAIRNRVVDVTLRVDANMGWVSAKEAIRHIKQLTRFDLELIEQPLHYTDVDGHDL